MFFKCDLIISVGMGRATRGELPGASADNGGEDLEIQGPRMPVLTFSRIANPKGQKRGSREDKPIGSFKKRWQI